MGLGAYQRFYGQAETDAGGETTHGGFGTYHLRFSGIEGGRYCSALYVARLYRRKNDGGESLDLRIATDQCRAERVSSVGRCH